MNKWMKTYWRTRKLAEFKRTNSHEINYAIKINDADSAVDMDPMNIELLKNPSEELKLKAITKRGDAIKFIKNPSLDMQFAAVRTWHAPEALKYIKDKGIVPSKELEYEAVKKNGLSIIHVDNPSEELQLLAVTVTPHALKGIIAKGINPSKDIQFTAVKEDGTTIEYIKNPPEEWKIIAVSNSKFAIRYIDNPSEAVQLASVKHSGFSLASIMDKNIQPSEEVQIEAIKQMPEVFNIIPNPTKKVKQLAKKLLNQRKNDI